jgi:hemerythrin
MNTLDVIAEFRNDHRKVRDSLLAITEAIGKKDVKKARDILGELNNLVGPHFRYEEEYLYPALRKFLGDYVDQLLSEHDGVIETAKKCASLLQKESLTEEEAENAQKAAMALLIHVSNCDGLAILSERFTSEELEELGQKFEESRKAGIPLFEWADTIRK